ncbi:Epidermal growth factor-related protein [Cavenderia fasciculata]|uniref:Epidermal growth factor-related protein n=1 Tax=Cavenderia fasciculata TaxID=261658 RepID=F4Q2C8_CACFS|nr:Epidermal growth factor-related protein [Cavenderia fasciculata]EGG18148.1 Epidermal growth factor-related protein [Cavenderia fasciculata]|eukprot:XP_004366189.1 Epidermal growth factor-related protein [Cavenderia fasciculata]
MTSISTARINSAIWLISQYGLSIPQNEEGICSDGRFICQMGTDGFNHINNMTFESNHKLVSISNFFSQSNLKKVLIYNSPISSMTIDQTTYAPKLENIDINIRCDQDQTVTFTNSSFPLLGNAQFRAVGASTKTMNIIMQRPIPYLSAYVQDKTSLGAVNPTISYPERILGLAIGGPNYVLSPSDLGLYTNLEILQILYTTSTTFPITPYPKLDYLHVSHAVTINSLDLISVNGEYNITGNNIGWGRGIDLVSGISPNRELIDTDFTFNITEVGFIFKSLTSTNNVFNNFEYKISFQYFNPKALPTIRLNSTGEQCNITSFDEATFEIFCLLINPKQGYDAFVIENAYHSGMLRVDILQKPIVTSYSLEPPTYPPTTLNLYGYFTTISFPNNTQVYVNYTIDSEGLNPCNVTLVSPTHISCLFTKVPKPGLTDMALLTEGGSFLSSTMPFFPAPIPTVDDCKIKTNNCNGHGTCTNGQCQCDQGWTDFDCKIETKTAPGVIIQPNYTNPIVNFTTTGNYSFSFNLMSIQELDYENIVINELVTDKWNVSTNETQDLTSISYLFNNQNKSLLYESLVVISLIEFSNQSRSIDFGGDTIQIAGGSIKISVNITNWPYQSPMSTLRVIFSTIINNDQSIVGCDNSINTIDTFQQSADNGTLQYLRVVKDNVQFIGRFLDFMAFSKTQVMNVTSYGDPSNNQSLAIIGINSPICSVCLLDPDFSALVVDPNNYDQSGSCGTASKDSDWKIIVAIVVSVVGAVAIVIGAYIYTKKNRTFKKLKIMIQMKMQTRDSTSSK